MNPHSSHNSSTTLLPISVYAADPASGSEVNVGVKIDGKDKFNYNSYIKTVYKFSLDIGFSLATLMIVYAGYRYLTSRGESGAINEAKDILGSALLGYAVLFLVRFILNFIGSPTAGVTGVGS